MEVSVIASMMSRRLAATCVLAVHLGNAVPASADSSFRGFTISDSPAQLETTAKEQGYTVKWGKPVFGFENFTKRANLIEGEEACAWIDFDESDKINRMAFSTCFFGAEGLGMRQVTQEFINKFGGNAEMEVAPDRPCKDDQVFLFKGRTSGGELFQISDSCGITVEIRPGTALKF